MYVAICRPRVHHAVCACAYRISVEIVNVHSMLTLIVAHQSRRTNSSMNSQRVIAGRDLENSLLKGRRSRLKQYTSLQRMIIVSIINDCGAVSVCKATVLNLYWALCLHVQHSVIDCY